MSKNLLITSASPLLLCAAIALALPACSTKSGQTSNSPPVLASPPEHDLKDVDEPKEIESIEEIVVTGSKLERRNDRQLTAREASQRARAEKRLRLNAMPAPAAMPSRSVAGYSMYNIQRPNVQNTEKYAHLENNAIKLTSKEPVSTFSIDVDTGAYANVRRFLNNQQLPPQDAVRVEELINYFSYDYPEPESTDVPFSVSTELSAAPWNNNKWLLQVGLKGYEVPATERPAANLVFLLDVSGSMNSPDKLPLLKKSFKLLTRQLNANDRISIVVYAGASGVVLEPTPGNQQRQILSALRKLQAGGSTNGAAGINLAYELAEEAFIDNGINRIVLATDGDFNVGTVNFEALKDMAERKRKSGVSLTTLGFGTGNYNDHLMEQLADAGNGNYAYIDSRQEARKVLVNQITSTLHTIAKDVKIQIEFNPDVVAEYRLIGYENRMLKRVDFTNDKVDAGEIGAGHTVTALYELVPVSSEDRSVIPLRYQTSTDSSATLSDSPGDEVAFIRLRYKQPNGDVSSEISEPIFASTLQPLDSSSANLRFSAAVAAFGQLLNGSTHIGDYTMEQVSVLAHSALSNDQHGYRHEFLELVDTADELFEDVQNTRVAKTD